MGAAVARLDEQRPRGWRRVLAWGRRIKDATDLVPSPVREVMGAALLGAVGLFWAVVPPDTPGIRPKGRGPLERPSLQALTTYPGLVFSSDTHDGNPIRSEPLRYFLPSTRITLLPCRKRSRRDNHPRLFVFEHAFDQSRQIRAQIGASEERSIEPDAAHRVLFPIV